MKIEEHLRKSSEDVPEPFAGHEERFELRLKKARQQNTIRPLRQWLRVAAAAAVLLAIGWVVVSNAWHTRHHAASIHDMRHPEVEAAEAYYKQFANIDFGQLNASDQRIQEFLREMNVLETEYKRLESLLAENFNNERVAKAMVENFQFRLKLMEQLRKYIEIQNQFNQQSHEQQLAS